MILGVKMTPFQI